MVRGMSQSEGSDPVVLHERLTALPAFSATALQPLWSLRWRGGIMTIHNAKGLERDVVVVAGLFSAGRQDASQKHATTSASCPIWSCSTAALALCPRRTTACGGWRKDWAMRRPRPSVPANSTWP